MLIDDWKGPKLGKLGLSWPLMLKMKWLTCKSGGLIKVDASIVSIYNICELTVVNVGSPSLLKPRLPTKSSAADNIFKVY